jgi:predicted PurR-regulated permease PerM
MRNPLLGKEQLEASATDFVVRLAFLGLFVWWSLEFVRPFVPIVIWAVLLAVALYPGYAWLARGLGGRRGLAATLLTGLMLAIVLGPVSVLAASLADSVQWLAAGLRSGTLKVPPRPAAVGDWPVVGKQVDEAWLLAATSLDDAVTRYGPAVLPAGGSILGKVADIGLDVLKFVASVIIAGFLFVPGPRLAAGGRARPPGFALVLTLLLVPVSLADNVLKPILMAPGLTTPMLVILTGVIGGTLTHGLVGLFLGPVVLSVFYELVVAWTRLGTNPPAASSDPEQP